MAVEAGRIVVAGAGIGGLTLAAALRRAGRCVTVFERAPVLGAAGAGITVQSNAMAALDTLGLSAAVAREGAVIRHGAMLRPDGAVLTGTDLEALGKALGHSSVAIHRARLQRVLLEAVGDEHVRTGCAVTGYEQDAGEVRVQLENGETLGADLLVGADGLRSAVRRVMIGDGEPVYAGYTSWRGISPTPPGHDAGTTTETWGRGLRFGVVPIGHGETYWFAVADAPAGGTDRDPQAELLQRFGEWHSPIPELIRSAPADRILRTDISDRPPLGQWSQGRVTLLGDAAHPMTPNLGQGGCQAIEDAVVLAACLESAADLQEALAAYERKRVQRANRIVMEARRLGEMGQASHPVQCWLRDTAMRLMPSSMVVRRLKANLRLPD